MRVHNDLPPTHPTFGYDVATSVHLHGSASLPQFDGYADDVTRPGHYKDYWYPNHQGARTLWYHDHGVAPHGPERLQRPRARSTTSRTAWEKENLPQGKYDVPLIVSDAMFAKNGDLAYMDRDHSGLFGDVISVNGVPWPYHEVERRFYRFRILLATLSRSMNLKFVNVRTGAVLPTYVVATDGGLMVPQIITNWRHGSAERYEMMVDFSGCLIGDTVELRNSSNKNIVDYIHTNKVMQFRVNAEASDSRWNTVLTPPATEINEVMFATAANSRRTRLIDLEHDDETNEFLINGMTWEDIQAGNWDIFTAGGNPPKPGDYEIWRIENKPRRAGTTRSTSTWSTSRSSAARAGPARSPRGRRARRTWCTWAKTRSSRCSSTTRWLPAATRTAAPRARRAARATSAVGT